MSWPAGRSWQEQGWPQLHWHPSEASLPARCSPTRSGCHPLGNHGSLAQVTLQTEQADPGLRLGFLSSSQDTLSSASKLAGWGRGREREKRNQRTRAGGSWGSCFEQGSETGSPPRTNPAQLHYISRKFPAPPGSFLLLSGPTYDPDLLICLTTGTRPQDPACRTSSRGQTPHHAPLHCAYRPQL